MTTNKRVGMNADGSGDSDFWGHLLPGEDFEVAKYHSQNEPTKTPIDIALAKLRYEQEQSTVMKGFAIPRGYEVEIMTPLGKRVAKQGEYVTTHLTFSDVSAGKDKKMKLVDIQEGNTSPLEQVAAASEEERIAIYAQAVQDYKFLDVISPDDIVYLQDYLSKVTGKSLDQCLADDTINEENIYNVLMQAAKTEADKVNSEEARMLYSGMDSLTKRQFMDYIQKKTKWTPREIENNIGLEISADEINNFLHQPR